MPFTRDSWQQDQKLILEMKRYLTLLISLTLLTKISAQHKSFRPTYTFEGHLESDRGTKLSIKMNFLILLDSTLVGSYNYNPQNGSLKLVGHLNADNTLSFVERDKNDSITGYFNGRLAADKKTASGTWRSPSKGKNLTFHLNQVVGESYRDYIKKNRSLYEYKTLKTAVREKNHVLSIDVSSQGLKKLPKGISKLPKVVSINLLGNEFSSFPKELRTLTQLDEISLSSNQLKHVGPEIGELGNLRILIMNNNQLKSLPKEIGDLTNLLYLEIGNNQLTSMPEELKYLTNLQELHIERNRISAAEKERIKKMLPNCIVHF